MIKFKHFVFGLMALVCTVGFTACGGSDDEGSAPVNLTDEPMAEHAAKYVVTSANSEYASIELLGNGKYIVEKSGSRMYASKKVLEINSIKDVASLFKAPVKQTRTGGVELYIFGEYTVNGEGVYNLDGFGQITVKNGSKIDIVRNDGFTCTVNVQKEEIKYSGENTKNLCRTWLMDQLEYDYWISRYHAFTITYTAESGSFEFTHIHPDFNDAFEDSGVDADDILNGMVDTGDMTKRVTFSPLGTYIVETNSGFTQVSSWKWGNEAAGIIYYNWSEDGFDDEVDGNGYVNVNFYANKVQFTEEYSYEDEEDEEESERMKLVTTLVAE